jgi:hypothetical protein
MIYGVSQVLKYLLGTDIAGRSLAVRPDDTFIVSYPRSGNTWTRFLIANLLHPTEPVTFANIERLIPDAEAQSSRYMKSIPSPRVIKSHQYFDHRYPKVIYIVRDPRDVVLSYYDFARKYRYVADGFPIEKYVSDFVAGRLGSSGWGTWKENVGSWISARHGDRNFLLLRYEDMIRNAFVEIEKIATFLGVETTQDGLRAAIELSSAERMRELEKSQGGEWVSTKNKRSDIPFVRTAESGQWRSKLTSSSVAEIEGGCGSLMATLGYELAESRHPDRDSLQPIPESPSFQLATLREPQ